MPSPRPWTIIAYLVADDSRNPPLNAQAQLEITGLKQAAARFPDMRVVAYADFTDARAKAASQLCVINGRNGGNSCGTAPEENAATTEALRNFLVEARTTTGQESRRYAMLFWGHGAGPGGLFLDPQPFPPTTLSIPEMWQAFQVLPNLPVELILFKDCWVNTLEIVYEFDDVARFIVGSQGEIPIPGPAWPWDAIFSILHDAPDPIDRLALKSVLRIFQRHYEVKLNRSVFPHVILAALELSQARGMILEPLRRLVEGLRDLDGEARKQSRRALETCSGGDRALVDVSTFCKAMAEIDPHTGRAAMALHRVLKRVVVGQTTGTPGVRHSERLTGVSLFHEPLAEKTRQKSPLMPLVFFDTYKHLSINGTTGWKDIAWEPSFP